MKNLFKDFRLIERRICWPNPDATCLEGGCIYCVYQPWKKFSTIQNYVNRTYRLPNRGYGYQDASVAWEYGLAHDFFMHAPVRYKEEMKGKWHLLEQS